MPKPSATSPRHQGFTLIEILVAITLMGITLAITTAVYISARNKALITHDLDQVYKALEYARQQSISAYQGHAYSITFTSPRSFRIEPENTLKYLHPSTQLVLPQNASEYELQFSKLTGTPIPPEPVSITLQAHGLEGAIHVDPTGYITKQPVTKP